MFAVLPLNQVQWRKVEVHILYILYIQTFVVINQVIRKKKTGHNKQKNVKDPFAEREATKYENPIPSREYIQELLRKQKKPLNFIGIANALSLTTEDQLEAIRRRLRAMERDGQLVKNRRGVYGLIDKMDLLRGRVIAHRDGFGFVNVETEENDLYLGPREMRKAFHGDVILARVINVDKRGRKEAQIVEVLESNTHTVVGRFYKDDAMVIPENKGINKDISIPIDMQNSAEDGQIVMVEIIGQPSMRKGPLGRIIEVLGEHLAPGMEISIALRSHDLPCTWPADVMAESHAIADTVGEQDKLNRTDLRDLPLVTIDGEDARDFDDAVYCKALPKGGWVLYVAIADVSHYVKPETALDKEGYNRGNSVYFPGEVIPMLPEKLSNGLCSLNPHVDRLCVVCEMRITAKGKLSGYRFYNAVMQSQARLTYTQVGALLLDDVALPVDYQHLTPQLHELNSLFKVLHKERGKRGAIEFETTEVKFIFDEARKIESIVPLERNVAHRIIEECMLLANVSAAKFIEKNKIPSLFRVHDHPGETKIQEFREFLLELGLRFSGGKKPLPREFAKLLASVAERPDIQLIQTVMLRTMRQAIYTDQNAGHFGLAYKEYAHFTSPIRRYPDLLLHRAIKHTIENRDVADFYYDGKQMHTFGEHCSYTERRANDATRDVQSWLKCEYMQHRLEQEYDGIIAAVTGFGLFVQLNDIFVDGLVHVTALENDYYHFDAIRHTLIGERTHIRYRLGDPMRVRVVRVDLDDRKIDFELAS